MSYDVFDHVELRCPKLGGEVTFGYCRTVDDGMPCPRALLCFELKFPVEEYFQIVLKEETFTRIFTNPPRTRLERFLDTVDAAAKRLQEKESSQ